MRKTDNQVFIVTLTISLLIHAVFFLPNNFFSLKLKPDEKLIDNNYPNTIFSQEIKAKSVHSQRRFTRIRGSKHKFKRVIKKNVSRFKPSDNEQLGNKNEDLMIKQTKFSEKQNKSKKISISKIKNKEQSQDEIFISYYRQVNEQLRQSVVYPDNFSEGEIALTFVLARDGSLRSVEVVDSTATDNLSLPETAMQIVEKASPFPPFPEKLQQSQLTFNVVICFREHT